MEKKLDLAIITAKKSERGQALIFVLLCLTCLLGFLGLATDVGTWLNAKRRIQTAADSAAIAGAAELNYGDVTAAAKADSASNGMTDGTNGVTVTVNNPPGNGPHVSDAKYVEVIVSQSEPAFFAKLFRLNSVMVRARSVAFLTAGQSCIVALGTSSTGISLGTASILATQCAVSSNAGIIGSGSLTAKSVGSVGAAGGSISPAAQTGMVPVSDPLVFLSEPALGGACNTALAAGGNIAVGWGPGCYSGISANGNAAVTLSPGIYILSGGSLSFTQNASVTGSGVTFFLTNGASANIGTAGALGLSAPTSGTYNGILFFESRADTIAGTVSGNGSANFQGILYFPSAGLTFSGNGALALIANAVSFSGNSQLQNYATVNSSSPITAGTLVE